MLHKCKQEARITMLEQWKIEVSKDVEALLNKLADVVWWTRTLVITLLPLILTAFAYLVLLAFGKEV